MGFIYLSYHSKNEINIEFFINEVQMSMVGHMGLVQVCGRCNEEMVLVEGDTIFGDKWYHKNCWESITKTMECKQ